MPEKSNRQNPTNPSSISSNDRTIESSANEGAEALGKEEGPKIAQHEDAKVDMTCEAAIARIERLHQLTGDLLQLEESAQDHNIKHKDVGRASRASTFSIMNQMETHDDHNRKKLAFLHMRPRVSESLLS